MVILKNWEIKPTDKLLMPGVEISATILTKEAQEVIVNISGQLRDSEQNILSFLHLGESNELESQDLQAFIPGITYNQKETRITMFDHLEERIIDRIENARGVDKKGNVKLSLVLYVEYIDNEVQLFDTYVIKNRKLKDILKIDLPENLNLIAKKTEKSKDFVDGNGEIKTLTTFNGPSIFNLRRVRLSEEKTIPSSDWVHDFQEPLGIGRFLVLEMPDPVYVKNGLVSINGNKAQEIISKRFPKMIETLTQLREYLKEGEWAEVVEKSRGIYDELRRDNRDLIKTIVSQTTGVSKDSAGKLSQALDNMYSYSNDLHHTINKSTKQVKDPFTGGKEDAYLTYSIAASLVNLIGKKLQRARRNEPSEDEIALKKAELDDKPDNEEQDPSSTQ